MSTATVVPETHGLDGERAIATMRRARAWPLLRDSAARLRWADGFSHSRAMAFQVVLTLIPGSIALVALAAELHWTSFSRSIIRVTELLAPGPAGSVFTDAFGQGAKAGSEFSGWPPLAFGGIAFLISGTTSFGQVERAANRIYGVEADRPTAHKYGLATVMMLSAGTLAVLGFLVIGLGQDWATGLRSSGLDDVWEVARWPLAAVLLTAAFALMFKISPRRRQPDVSWLAVGALLSVVGCLVVSLLLHLYLTASQGFGDTYGPLAGFMGVMLWTYLVSIAIFFGLAFAAELEAVRAGAGEPRSAQKVHDSDPASDPTELPEITPVSASRG